MHACVCASVCLTACLPACLSPSLPLSRSLCVRACVRECVRACVCVWARYVGLCECMCKCVSMLCTFRQFVCTCARARINPRCKNFYLTLKVRPIHSHSSSKLRSGAGASDASQCPRRPTLDQPCPCPRQRDAPESSRHCIRDTAPNTPRSISQRYVQICRLSLHYRWFSRRN